MATILTQAQRIEEVEYSLEWDRGDGSGYTIPAYADGQPVASKRVRYRELRAEVGTVGWYVKRHVKAYTEPVTLRCDCGATVWCDDSWANGCAQCGREYNGYGQALAPRSQWGYETGERFA